MRDSQINQIYSLAAYIAFLSIFNTNKAVFNKTVDNPYLLDYKHSHFSFLYVLRTSRRNIFSKDSLVQNSFNYNRKKKGYERLRILRRVKNYFNTEKENFVFFERLPVYVCFAQRRVRHQMKIENDRLLSCVE
jgi:hypothetical protein